jgi:hypothetical protein
MKVDPAKSPANSRQTSAGGKRGGQEFGAAPSFAATHHDADSSAENAFVKHFLCIAIT